jgi:DNA-binding transcriptional LysR family regulator
VELRQLNYFATIARMRGFRRAADELLVSEATLSEQIKHLEEELGVRLLERTSRRVDLTEAGRVLLARTERALVEIRTAREEMADFAELQRGQLTVGSLPNRGAFWFPSFLAEFLRMYPSVDLRLIERPSRALLKLLDGGDVQVACLLLPATGEAELAGIATERLADDDLAVVLAREHPFATRPGLCIDDLLGERLIVPSPEETSRQVLDEAFFDRGFEPSVAFEANDPITLIRLAAAGVGVGITGGILARQHQDKVVTLPLEGGALQYSVAMAWSERGPQTRAVTTFLRAMRSWWRDLEPGNHAATFDGWPAALWPANS